MSSLTSDSNKTIKWLSKHFDIMDVDSMPLPQFVVAPNSTHNNTNAHPITTIPNPAQQSSSNVHNDLHDITSSASNQFKEKSVAFAMELESYIQRHLPALPPLAPLPDINLGATSFNSSNGGDGMAIDSTTENTDSSDANMQSSSTAHHRQHNQMLTVETQQLRQQLQNMRQQLHSITQQKIFFEGLTKRQHLCLTGIKQMCSDGVAPKYKRVPMAKPTSDGIIRSEKLAKLYRKIKRSGQYDNSKWKIEAEEKWEHYFDSILQYIRHNGEYCSEPQIYIRTSRNANASHNSAAKAAAKAKAKAVKRKQKLKAKQQRQRRRKKKKDRRADDSSVSDSDDSESSDSDSDEDDEHWHTQSGVVETFTINSHPYIPALVGQTGLRSKIDIPKGTVLGRCIGVEYFDNEWQSIYLQCRDESLHSVYSFTSEIDDLANEDRVYKMIIDPIALRNLSSNSSGIKKRPSSSSSSSEDASNLMLYVNDCRKDMFGTESPSESDELWWNVGFVRVKLNGWPAIFIVTRRDITAHTELLGWYGHQYYGSGLGNNHLRRDGWYHRRGVIAHTVNPILRHYTNQNNLPIVSVNNNNGNNSAANVNNGGSSHSHIHSHSHASAKLNKSKMKMLSTDGVTSAVHRSVDSHMYGGTANLYGSGMRAMGHQPSSSSSAASNPSNVAHLASHMAPHPMLRPNMSNFGLPPFMAGIPPIPDYNRGKKKKIGNRHP